MRILQLCSDFPPGGIQRHVLDLAEGLRRKGHHVTLAGTRGDWMNEDVCPDFFHIDIFHVTDAGGRLGHRLLTALKSGMALRKIIRRERIELVHAHESAPALVAWIATRGLRVISSRMDPSDGSEIMTRIKVPVIVTFHGAEPERIGEFGRIARMTADVIVTPSHNSARDLVERGGVPEAKLRVMGLGVQQKPRPPAAEVEALRRDLLGNEGRKLIVTVARLAHQKGIDILVEAARRALTADPSLRFVIVGDGPQREDARRWAQEAGVEDKVRFVGHSDTAPLYLAAADLFFLSSRWESLPITIVEAFQQGTPVLATDTAGVVELVDSDVGQVVPIGDVNAMAHALIDLTGNPARLARMAEAALARAGEPRFSPAHVHESFERLYADTLARPEWRRA